MKRRSFLGALGALLAGVRALLAGTQEHAPTLGVESTTTVTMGEWTVTHWWDDDGKWAGSHEMLTRDHNAITRTSP